jgi:plastocyanin
MKYGFEAITIAVTLLSVSLQAAPVTGHVRIAGRPPSAVVQTIVYAESLDGGRPQGQKFRMTQKNKTFVPHVLAIPVGSTIAFPNDDSIFHNVFSLSRPAPFDLGLYREGASKSLTFSVPTTYWVFCNIHPQMSSIILVLPTSYITEADARGNYRLDLPPGRYRVTAWSERAEPASVELTVSAGPASASEILLGETKFVDAQHKNKFGQEYPRAGYDPKKN